MTTIATHQKKINSHGKEQLFGGEVQLEHLRNLRIRVPGLFIHSLLKMFPFEILCCDRWNTSFPFVGLGLKEEGGHCRLEGGQVGGGSPLRSCKLEGHKAPGDGL